MERIHIPRDDERNAPGTWRFFDGQPHHRCPECKKGSVMSGHSVEADGMVNPSIACFPPCKYHIFGILDGWTCGPKKAGGRID